ncbi:hypothetical protein NUU61_002700 [Penicillium alfredii]|uniref:Zn(2)-C6 fungal-type domain-containing protein n=1 Tax=Penicillium alfredii TaxID=1506179 RepID=A0A9W9FS30_9EURO|nr:uncharacterized protein NUU61_002700 [Penicillium alfredii]KAJ5105353.1 hypothetical protein NUU61_002700 [Penicillium alfredii]
MVTTSVATQGSTRSGMRAVIDDDAVASRKRKASELSNKPATARQKITRACDSCKLKKTRCNGTLPCTRCTRLSLPCKYNAAYSRGLPPEPPPASSRSFSTSAVRRESGDARQSNSPRSRSIRASTQDDQHQSLLRQRPAVSSPRTSPEPGSTDFEGNYLGPASGVSFINRVWSRLHQDETTHIPDELQRESSRNTAVFMFGDKPYSDYQEAEFTLPSFDKSLELVGIYFDFSIVTYRFLHRGSVEEWVKYVYRNNISLANPPVGNMVARTAIVLMVFAVSTLYEELQPGETVDERSKSERWYAASKYMSSLESGPPRLETIQARLGQCLYLLSSSRANECWYSFGTALQVVTALGLHRKWPAKLSKNECSYLELELRKRIFWSAYTLDKYLSIMFGRSRLLRDEDLDQELPDEMNDEDLLEEDPARRTGSADSMMIASALHYRLGRILGDISRQLYSINPFSRDSALETAVRLTSELERWKESVPPLFNSVRPSSLIPPLCRQSQVLQLAYSHAMIHVTRSFLLNDFTDLSRRPTIPHHPTVSTHVQKCIEAAQDVMTLVDSLAQQGILIQSFWFTHYVTFCAILVVYIHTIQQHRQSLAPSPGDDADDARQQQRYLFSLAETCQQHLAEATRKNCPSRRYSIILEELRREVRRQIGSDDTASATGQARAVRLGIEDPAAQNAGSPNGPDRPLALDPGAMALPPIPGILQPAELGESPIDRGDDIGFLESLEGSIWWTQLDSWALSSFPNDPSTFTF